jgi:DNA-directed RNA polymerase specialized sigma24 family protein
LRSRLADAFGRVSVAIGAATEFLPEDREIILLLWRDGRSVAEVARYLAVPASRVQQTRNRVLERLKRGLLRRRRLKKED